MPVIREPVRHNLKLLSFRGTAAALNISDAALRQWAKEADFPKPRRIRNRFYYLESELAAWLEAQKGGADHASK
jgi:predicted DNA-binding transcriptional regulator AlpA